MSIAATTLLGGAVVGHELDKRTQQQNDSYNIQGRLNIGGGQIINVKSINDLASVTGFVSITVRLVDIDWFPWSPAYAVS